MWKHDNLNPRILPPNQGFEYATALAEVYLHVTLCDLR